MLGNPDAAPPRWWWWSTPRCEYVHVLTGRSVNVKVRFGIIDQTAEHFPSEDGIRWEPMNHTTLKARENQASLAFNIAKREAMAADIDVRRFRKLLEVDPTFIPYFDQAKARVSLMDVQFIELRIRLSGPCSRSTPRSRSGPRSSTRSKPSSESSPGEPARLLPQLESDPAAHRPTLARKDVRCQFSVPWPKVDVQAGNPHLNFNDR
jgi:hypothetical protein